MKITREQWLERRKYHLGASDCPAVLGVDPHKGGFEVYHSKVSGVSKGDREWLSFGRDVEGAIANMYAHKTERMVVDIGATEIKYHPVYEWIGATLDRQTCRSPDLGMVPLELKFMGLFSNPKEWAADPPLHQQIQLQIQMACTGAKWGCLAAMFPGYQLEYVDLERNDDFLDSAYPILWDFWQKVQRREPPPVDSPKCLDLVKKMYRPSGKSVAMDNDTLLLAREWEDAKIEARTATKRAKELEAELRLKMKDASSGEFFDGSELVMKITKRKGYTVEPTEFNQLKWRKND